MKILFATQNAHKIEEVKAILGASYEVMSLKDMGFEDDIPENEPTLHGNAKSKAEFVYKRYGLPCFADDSGLEVKVLNGAPGVRSARYAGESNPSLQDVSNTNKLLSDMQGITDRRARFRTVVAYMDGTGVYYFEGYVTGVIEHEVRGNGGFGYDPVFTPDGYECRFSELSMADKNKISHRGQAIRKFAEFLL